MGNPPNLSDKCMENLAGKRVTLGRFFRRHPIQILMYMIAILIITVAFAIAYYNKEDIKDIQSAFCNGNSVYTNMQKENCRKLMDQLLRDPTPGQKVRLRILVKEGSK